MTTNPKNTLLLPLANIARVTVTVITRDVRSVVTEYLIPLTGAEEFLAAQQRLGDRQERLLAEPIRLDIPLGFETVPGRSEANRLAWGPPAGLPKPGLQPIPPSARVGDLRAVTMTREAAARTGPVPNYEAGVGEDSPAPWNYTVEDRITSLVEDLVRTDEAAPRKILLVHSTERVEVGIYGWAGHVPIIHLAQLVSRWRDQRMGRYKEMKHLATMRATGHLPPFSGCPTCGLVRQEDIHKIEACINGRVPQLIRCPCPVQCDLHAPLGPTQAVAK